MVFIPVMTLVALPLSSVWRFRVLTTWPRVQLLLLKVLCGVNYVIDGKENIPDGAAIFMSKHQSTWETFVFNSILPHHVWVLKREIMWLPLFGWGIAMLKPIAIDRSSGKKSVQQLITQGRQRLDSGLSVIIFPEGTRIPPHMRGRYKMGGSILASETGYPVVPIAHNAGTFWPRRSFLIYPGTVRVVIGPVINTRGRNAEDIKNETEKWIETTMRTLEGRTGPAKLFIR